MPEKVQAILFDLGETLLEFGQVDLHRAFRRGAELTYEYLRESGRQLPPLAVYHRRQYRAVRRAYLKSRLTRREFKSTDLLKKLSHRMGHDIRDDEALHLARLYYQPLREHAVADDGLSDMLKSFRDAGITLGVVSNTFVPAEALDDHLQDEGLLELLAVRVYSCEFGVRKPSGKIFRAALEQAEAPAARTMFVGDSPYQDIYGANAAGMISVLVGRAGRYRNLFRPRHTIRRLAELPKIVARYNG